MTTKTPPLPEPNEIRAIARDYALECQRLDLKPTLQGICSRFQRHPRWLTASPTATATIVRAIVLKQWREMDIPLTAGQLGLDPQPKPVPQPKTQPKPAPQPDPEPEAMPTEYLSGDALFEVLQHPGRLRQFCSLVDTIGTAGAFRYAQMVRDFHRKSPSRAAGAVSVGYE